MTELFAKLVNGFQPLKLHLRYLIGFQRTLCYVAINNTCCVAEFEFQKQLFRGVLVKRCSENMRQIYRRTPMPKFDFNKVAKQLDWNHYRHGCAPANLVHSFQLIFLRTPLKGCFWSLRNFSNKQRKYFWNKKNYNALISFQTTDIMFWTEHLGKQVFQ